LNRGPMNIARDPRAEQNPNAHGSGRQVDSKTARSVFLRLAGYVLQHWPLFLIALVFTLLSNQLALLGPKYSGEAIDPTEAEGDLSMTLVRSAAERIEYQTIDEDGLTNQIHITICALNTHPIKRKS